MEAKLKVLAILAFVATTGAGLIEFSEDNYIRYGGWGKADFDSGPYTAQLFNVGDKLLMNPNDGRKSGDDGLYMFWLEAPTTDPDPKNKGKECENSMGIYVDTDGGRKTFCEPHYLALVTHIYQNGKASHFWKPKRHDKTPYDEVLEVVLTLRCGDTGAFRLSIPVFNTTATGKQLKNFAKDNNVLVDVPFSEYQLNTIRQKYALPIGFDWLVELLKYKVYKVNTFYPALGGIKDVFLTRPIVLSNKMADMYLDVVYLYMEKTRKKLYASYDV